MASRWIIFSRLLSTIVVIIPPALQCEIITVEFTAPGSDQISSSQGFDQNRSRKNSQDLLASKAVNISLTLRNWSIGYYIERYERLGVDRAKYGERLMDDLSETLRKPGLSRCDRRELYRYRQFYLTYPQIVEERLHNWLLFSRTRNNGNY